jgi:hypothetical protein
MSRPCHGGEDNGRGGHPVRSDRRRQNLRFQALVALWPARLAYIEGDTSWPWLVNRREGDDRQRDFRALMRAMVGAASQLARSGYEVLVDFSLPPSFLPPAQKTLRDTPLDCVLLNPPASLTLPRPAVRWR